MWIITSFGFFSVVEKPSDRHAGTVTIRGRVKSDLEKMKSKYLREMGPIIENGGTDYRYRATVSRTDFAAAMEEIAADIDYSNFKSSVSAKQGQQRAHVYEEVWSVLYGLEDEEPATCL
jgi:hypothetical protein